MTVERLITAHIDTWTSALKTRSTAGRGSNGKIDLYGIKKLRELILELAVRGKLVPQDPNDEPASELLKRIAAEKAELVKQGKIKKQKPLPEIREDEKPFELPVGWEWTRMDYVGHDWGQKTPERDFTYIDVGSINKDFGIIVDPVIINPKDAPSRARKIVRRNTVLYSTVRPYLLNIAVVSDDFHPEPIASTAFAIVHPWKGISSIFVYHYLRSPIFISYVESCQTGIAYPAINDKQFFSGVIAIPPSEEQFRIADKINELMSLCDQLEQQSLTSLDAHQQLVETLLSTLTESHNAEELAKNWSRISQHFDSLFTTEASIDSLKQTILQLAVMGKLTEQVKADSLECKTSLVDGLSIYDDINDRIPKTWALTTLDNISSAIIDCPHSTPKWASEGFICVRTSQIKPGYLELKDSRYVSEETYIERIQRLEPFYNDILYSREGGVLGVACRIPDGTKICLGQRMMLIRPSDKVFPEYLEIVLNSPLITFLARQMTTGGAAPRVNVSTVKKYLIPLPLKEEQFKIISRVNELIALCDTLKARLQSAQKTQLHLADALTDAALN
jgi:type I restriction enzyme S subunit